ncbi:MAG TPA: hypothetical protein VEW04_09285 [Allosphingosinicella sp.]|nr:hypothetical protein [Allosphingosinicella sp.]
MTRIPLLTLLASAAIGGGVMAATAPEPDPEADMARILAGRVELPTVSCVNIRNLGGNRTVGDAIVFGGGQRRIYVNHPPGGCPDLEPGRSLHLRARSSQLCRGDIVSVVDHVSGTNFGGCGLGDFTPYDRTN